MNVVHRLRQCCQYARQYGFFALAEKIAVHVDERPSRLSGAYEAWRRAHMRTAAELARQRRQNFSYAPRISILVPAWRTPLPFFRAMLDSVRAQTYGRWELVIADGSGEDAGLAAATREVGDRRIRYLHLAENRGISGNTNAALREARGDCIALLDHDDLLAPDALFEVVRALQGSSPPELIYTDEDKVDASGMYFSDPHFKPGFSPALFCANNYICHFSVLSHDLVRRAELSFDSSMDGAQDYDFLLRASEQARGIRHIPRVLYHWRVHPASTASAGAAKPYTHEAGRRAVAAHLVRCGIQAAVEDGADGRYANVYRVRYAEAETEDVAVIRWGGQTTVRQLAQAAGASTGEWLFFQYDGVRPLGGDPALVAACRVGGAAASGARLLCGRRTLPMGALWTGQHLQPVGGHLLRASSGYRYHSLVAHELDVLSPYVLCLSRETYEMAGAFAGWEGLPAAAALAALTLRVTAAGGRCVYEPAAQYRMTGACPLFRFAEVSIPEAMPESIYWNENAAILAPYLRE